MENNVPKSRHCAYCLKEFSDTKICNGCKRRAYCSRECQEEDWYPSRSGQGHKLWCKLNCGEEDLDWKVFAVPGKGLGVIALRDFPALTRIMVDRGYSFKEATKRRDIIMDLKPENETFEEKFFLNSFGKKDGKTVRIYPRVSRVNHACIPNAHQSNQEVGNYVVKVIVSEKLIKAGEEICISYSSFTDIFIEEKNNAEFLLDPWGIVCPPDCGCKDPEKKALLQRARHLNKVLMDFGKSRRLSEAMLVNLELLKMYEIDGLLLKSEKSILLHDAAVGQAILRNPKACRQYLTEELLIRKSIDIPSDKTIVELEKVLEIGDPNLLCKALMESNRKRMLAAGGSF